MAKLCHGHFVAMGCNEGNHIRGWSLSEIRARNCRGPRIPAPRPQGFSRVYSEWRATPASPSRAARVRSGSHSSALSGHETNYYVRIFLRAVCVYVKCKSRETRSISSPST